MEPLISNSSSRKCGDAIPSNCVPWNSGIIPCIPNCVGDSVGDIVVKLGNQLCYNQSLTDLTTLDISCWYSPCPTCQNPTSIVGMFQTFSDYICTLKTTINALNAQILALGGTPPPNV